MLIFHVHANVPAPTTFVTTAVISKQGGKYGTKAEVAIPTITGGQGSLTGFEATIHKTWTYKGQKQSLLLATLPDRARSTRTGTSPLPTGPGRAGKWCGLACWVVRAAYIFHQYHVRILTSMNR